MKMISIVFVLCFIFLSSCSDSPSEVTEKFFENLAHGNLEKAKEYATDGTCKQLDKYAEEETLEVHPDYECDILSEEIDGNKAVVTLDGDELFAPNEVNLIKTDRKWKVYFNSHP